MKASRYIIVFALVLLFCAIMGCAASKSPSAGPDGRITLSEPAYRGESKDGYPLFRFSWSKIKKLSYYDMAIFVELDGYSERSRVSFTDADETSAEIPFLKGIRTDTATYRIKIRPLSSANDAWSDVWQISFVDGAYTITANAPDFDEPAAPAAPVQSNTPVTTGAPAEHVFPEPLLDYAKKARLIEEGVNLSDAATLYVQVNHCEYGEPTQTITNASIVSAAADAIAGIAVTGGSDDISSTGTYYAFQFADANDNTLASFSFQDGMLMERDGRYPVSGLDALYAVDGVMLSADWEAHWAAEAEKESAYAQNYHLQYPTSVFSITGYNASLLADVDPASIQIMRVSVSWNDHAGKIETADPETILALYEALSGMRVVEKANEDDPVGQKWSVDMHFIAPDKSTDDVLTTAYLSFEGNYLLSDMLDGGTAMPYVVEGLDAFFDSVDADVLRYLKAYRNTPRPDPTYS